MKYVTIFSLIILPMLVVACQSSTPACPTTTANRRYLATLPANAFFTPTPGPSATSAIVEINGRAMPVSKIVKGPLCNDTWEGIVYVSCDVQVRTWVDKPLFLKGCNLSVEPGTIVYVAAHNNAAFYNGCSCHTGEEP